MSLCCEQQPATLCSTRQRLWSGLRLWERRPSRPRCVGMGEDQQDFRTPAWDEYSDSRLTTPLEVDRASLQEAGMSWLSILSDDAPEAHTGQERSEDEVGNAGVPNIGFPVNISREDPEQELPRGRRSVWRCSYPGCTSQMLFTRICDLRKHYRYATWRIDHNLILMMVSDGTSSVYTAGIQAVRGRLEVCVRMAAGRMRRPQLRLTSRTVRLPSVSRIGSRASVIELAMKLSTTHEYAARGKVASVARFSVDWTT